MKKLKTINDDIYEVTQHANGHSPAMTPLKRIRMQTYLFSNNCLCCELVPTLVQIFFVVMLAYRVFIRLRPMQMSHVTAPKCQPTPERTPECKHLRLIHPLRTGRLGYSRYVMHQPNTFGIKGDIVAVNKHILFKEFAITD